VSKKQQQDSTRGLQQTRGVDSARRVLQILLDFSENRPDVTIEEVAQKYGLSAPSAYRYMALLRELYLVEERSRGRYVLAPQVLRLAAAAERSFDLGRVARPYLDRLREETNETALVVKRIRDGAVCLAVSQPDKSFSYSFLPGHIMALHRGAVAKALLAKMPGRDRETYLGKVQPPLKADEIARIKADLAKINETGLAESESEVDPGVWAVASPIIVSGHTLGAVSVVAPSFHVDDQLRKTMRDRVQVAAVDISNAIAVTGEQN
jgi:DNA-binding IclR family transcriptional regulator